LPLFAIGAGVVHAIGIAILLPLLITLPGPGGDIPQRPVNIEVDVGSPDPPQPIVPDVSTSRAVSDEATSALPASPQPDVGAAESEPKSEIKNEAPDALANVSPEASPDSGQDAEQEAAPSRAKPAASAARAKRVKPKVEAKSAKPVAKVVRAPQPKKPALARAKPSKPLFKGSTARAKVKTPAQGSWTSLLHAPPSAADAQ
jgi:hypothetical protein